MNTATNESLAIFTLCPHCNKEGSVPLSNELKEWYANNHPCPHCNETIQAWLRIVKPVSTPPPAAEGKLCGADLIKAERLRQIHKEGWSAEHDDGHKNGEMLLAAIVYAANIQGDVGSRLAADVDTLWPWHEDWWRPSGDPVRDLTKAGALIAAEIDRLQRAHPDDLTPETQAWRPTEKLSVRILTKSLLVAKAALENARKFVQQHGSEDDAGLNHDGFYHAEHCLTALGEPHPEPVAPTWSLPDPPTNRQWHRVDGWTEEMLPPGTRPLLLGENWILGDEIFRNSRHHGGKMAWDTAGQQASDILDKPVEISTYHCRTRRPLPAQQPEKVAQSAGDMTFVQATEGIVEVVEMPAEYDEVGVRLRPRFNCNFRKEISSSFTTLHAITNLLEHLNGKRVRLTIEVEKSAVDQQAAIAHSHGGTEVPALDSLISLFRATVNIHDGHIHSESIEKGIAAVRDACLKASPSAKFQSLCADVASDAQAEGLPVEPVNEAAEFWKRRYKEVEAKLREVEKELVRSKDSLVESQRDVDRILLAQQAALRERDDLSERFNGSQAISAKYRAERDELRQQLAAQSGWIDFTDRMPCRSDGDDFGDVLWRNRLGRIMKSSWNHGDPNASPQGWFWMSVPPLPPLPADAKDGER